MRGRVIAGILTPVLVLAGAAGYLAADAADLVPGWFTTSPVPVAPAPFLTAEPVEASAAAIVSHLRRRGLVSPRPEVVAS